MASRKLLPILAAALLALPLPLGTRAAPATAAEPAADTAGAEFFEAKVRPILAERCYKCHSQSAEKVKAGLLLDTRDGILKGGENGPAVVPGHPEQSLLVKAVRYEDKDLQMPPKQPLPAEQVAVIEQWVSRGATAPQTVPDKAATGAKELWSSRPVRPITPPAVRGADWPSNDIDRFILAKLEAQGLHPSPPADRPELLRRVTFDLTGLPPTPEEMDAFTADTSPDAYEKVVDRLLASPRYGERWGRHWLDVIRFGESHGYEQNHLRDRAWPYRDYVIRAFNEDKPYPAFVAEQLAGDVLAANDPAASPDAATATGFLVAGVHDTVGNNAEQAKRQQRADDLDDIVSTVGATFLGLTVGCAKCHDHKFDPIPQSDYYALCAVFAGVRHEERALPAQTSPDVGRERERVAQRMGTVSAEIKQIEAQASSGKATPGEAPGPTRPAVSARRNVEDFAPKSARFIRFTILATADGTEPCLDELEVYAPGGGPNLALASAGAKASASSLLPGYAIHQVVHLNDGRYGNEHSWVSNQPGGGWAQIELPRDATVSRVAWSRDNAEVPKYNDRLAVRYRVEVSTDGKTWHAVATGDDRTAGTSPDRVSAALTPEQRRRREGLQSELKQLTQYADGLDAPRAYVGNFTAPDPIYLLKRGDVMQRGEVAAPAGLSRLPGLPPDLHLDAAAPESARRLALARWICDPRNPFTARVLVNRVWQHHFGRGIVGTPSDFGANGEPPTHPELLDWLAADFVKGGWTLKRLHRQILLSRTYRQTSRPDAAALAAGLRADGGNRLLWRASLRRLEAEAVRDSILSVSGKLDLSPSAVGGPGFRLFKYRVVNIALYDPLPDQGPETWRRAVYQQTARNIHDDLMAAFDEPENAQRTPRRESTTSPLQALTLMNSPLAVRQSEFFADRLKAEAGPGVEAQVSRAFRLALGREPTDAEREAGVELANRWGLAVMCRGLFNANEFLTY